MHDREANDASANERDQAASLRDIVACGFDGHGEELDREAEEAAMGAESPAELRRLVAAVVRRGGEERERSAADRARASEDREAAGHDRERAKRDRQLAGLDDLTGVVRRAPGLKLITTELERTARERVPLTLAYVDVDGLKAVNDGWGHSAGDQVLRTVAGTMRERLRVYDLVVRVGGDEFVCALPGLGVDEARERFAKLARGLNTEHGLTITVGLAEPKEGEGAEAVIARADADLLHARTRERATRWPRSARLGSASG